MFDWCASNQHDKCRRQYNKMYFDPRGGMVVTTDIVKCKCTKKGCACYVPPADRPKTTKRRKK